MEALLLSNSTNFGNQYMEHAHEVIAQFLGDVKEVLFVPYAGVTVTYDAYTATVQQALKQHDIRVISIHQVEDPSEAIKRAKAIAVGGGNTFRLVEQLYANNVMQAIYDAVQNGAKYIGWSAGSNVAGPTLCTTNDMPIVEPPSFSCLNLVPFQINPHYSEATIPNHGGESRVARIQEYVTINSRDVVCLPEGSWLEISGDKIGYFGNDAMKVYRGNSGATSTYDEISASSYFNRI